METYLIDYDMGSMMFVVSCEKETPMTDVFNTAITEVEDEIGCGLNAPIDDVKMFGGEYTLECYQDNAKDKVLMGISPIKVVHVTPKSNS